ncbi:MAG: aminotransferase class V-fold PLP-dependent enzyme [Evtepia sp.]
MLLGRRGARRGALLPGGPPGGVVADALSQRGVAVRAGLHCAPLAMPPAAQKATGTVRVSVSAFNTSGEVERFLKHMARLG